MKKKLILFFTLLFAFSALLMTACSGDAPSAPTAVPVTDAPATQTPETPRAETFAFGERFGAAIKTDGSLWTWGSNRYGQLGNGTRMDSPVPVKVMDDVVAVSCGNYHTAAIKSDGSLWTWGSNWWGQLGNGREGNARESDYSELLLQTVPVKVADDVARVFCGATDTICLRSDGVLLYAGENEFWTGLLGGDHGVFRAIMTGIKDVCRGYGCGVIREDDSLWMWGNNTCGQLMTGGTGAVQEPVKVMEDVLLCACTPNATAVVKKDGSLWTCGANDHGELGNGGGFDISDGSGHGFTVTPVHIMDGVKEVRAGDHFFTALTRDGGVFTWGSNELATLGVSLAYPGTLSDGSGMPYIPFPVRIAEDAVGVDCGFWNAGLLKSDGSLLIWGTASDGALGNGSEGDLTDVYGRKLQTFPTPVFEAGTILFR